MINKVWYEMVHIKFGEIYLSKYIGFQRTLKKIFVIISLILSASGILGWKYFQDYVWIALIIILVMQLLTLVENQIIRSDKEVEEISILKMMYTRYFNKLEKLWAEYDCERKPEEEVLDVFYELRNSDWEAIENLDCKLDVKRINWLMGETEQEANDYINLYHRYE